MDKSVPFIDFISAKGRPVAEINPGSKELALQPSTALKALHVAAGSDMAILGGDILSDVNGRLNYTGDNWYCDREFNEPARTYIDRSQEAARDYLVNVVDSSRADLYVVLVYKPIQK